MPLVVGVKFKDSGKIYHFDPNEHQLELGVAVVVETVRGLELGKVAMPTTDMPESNLIAELKPVVRQPTLEDYDRMKELEKRHDEVMHLCSERIAAHRLPMRLVRGDWSFDGTRLTIYFTSQQRVDFRHLVRELARIFHARIELRQVGARDEAKLLGGIGPCGRPLCCSTFLPDFARVSVKMAKDQDLPLNPSKISGVCGRLLCCLSYEQDQYLAIREELPVRGEQVMTPDGPGIVVAVNTIRETVTVDVEGNYSDFTAAQLSTVAQGAVSVARDRRNRGEAAPVAQERIRPTSNTPPASLSFSEVAWAETEWPDSAGDRNQLAPPADLAAPPASERPARDRDHDRRRSRPAQPRREPESPAPNRSRREPEAPGAGRPNRPSMTTTARQQSLGGVPEQLTPRQRQPSPDPDEPRTGNRRRRRSNRTTTEQQQHSIQSKPAAVSQPPREQIRPAGPASEPGDPDAASRSRRRRRRGNGGGTPK
jgi:cell fate regulator YaaT (PSP1 superfamily)